MVNLASVKLSIMPLCPIIAIKEKYSIYPVNSRNKRPLHPHECSGFLQPFIPLWSNYTSIWKPDKYKNC